MIATSIAAMTIAKTKKNGEEKLKKQELELEKLAISKEQMKKKKKKKNGEVIINDDEDDFEDILIRNGCFDIIDIIDDKNRKKNRKEKDNDALSRFLDDARAVCTLAPVVLPDSEQAKEIVNFVRDLTDSAHEKRTKIILQRFKIDMLQSKGIVDNDPDAVSEEVQKALMKEVACADLAEEDDLRSLDVTAFDTRHLPVTKSFMKSFVLEAADAVVVVIDFREKDEGIVITETNDYDDDDYDDNEDDDDDDKNTDQGGGIVKPDLKTSIKSLHPFANSVRKLSQQLGSENIFLAVTNCGDDFVEKRDWCELLHVPPENISFCQSSFLSELADKSNRGDKSASHVDISSRIVEWVMDWRNSKGISFRKEFKKSRETVHFFATLKDAYFVPFDMKKKNVAEEEEEEGKEVENKVDISNNNNNINEAKKEEQDTNNNTEEGISKKVVESHMRISLKTVSACFDRAIEGMASGVINGAPLMAQKFDKNYASTPDGMITRNQLHYFVSSHTAAQYPVAFILAWAVPGPFMSHPVHLSNRFRIALCFAIVGGHDYLNMETIATVLALAAGADGVAVLNSSFGEKDLERQESDYDDYDYDKDSVDSEEENTIEKLSAAIKLPKHNDKILDQQKTPEGYVKAVAKSPASFSERVSIALSAIESSTAEIRQNAENAIKDAFTIADRTVAKAEQKAKKLTRKALNRALDDGLITRKQALDLSKDFFRNAFFAYVVRDLSALICGPRYLLFTQTDFTQIVNSSMTFYVAETACKAFLPTRFNSKEKLELASEKKSPSKSLSESDAAIKAKEYVDAASERLAQTAESAKQTAEAARIKAQETAAKAQEAAQEAARVAHENATKAKEALWSYISSFSSTAASASDKNDENPDADLIDLTLDPSELAAKLVPQIPSYKIVAAMSGPQMKKALAMNVPSLLADADCRDLGFTKSVWTGNSKEQLEHLFAKYDDEKRVRAVARKALVLCLQSSNKQLVAEELKRCGLMQSEKSEMHLKLEKRQKEKSNDAKASSVDTTAATPPTTVDSSPALPTIPAPTSFFANWTRSLKSKQTGTVQTVNDDQNENKEVLAAAKDDDSNVAVNDSSPIA